MMKQSEQMTNLMAQYGVTTEKALVRAIRDELNAMCWTPDSGPKFTLRDAEVDLDGMLEAEYQRIAGGAYLPTTEETWERLADLQCERHATGDATRPCICGPANDAAYAAIVSGGRFEADPLEHSKSDPALFEQRGVPSAYVADAEELEQAATFGTRPDDDDGGFDADAAYETHLENLYMGGEEA